MGYPIETILALEPDETSWRRHMLFLHYCVVPRVGLSDALFMGYACEGTPLTIEVARYVAEHWNDDDVTSSVTSVDQ